MANDLLFGKESRNEIAKGIKILADAVKVTLGPRGRNVIIEQEFGTPLIINDGVTIAKNIVLENKYQNLFKDVDEKYSKDLQTVKEVDSKSIIAKNNPLIKEKIKDIFPVAEIFDGSKGTAKHTFQRLKDMDLLSTYSSGRYEVLSSAAERDAEHFKEKVKRLMNKSF